MIWPDTCKVPGHQFEHFSGSVSKYPSNKQLEICSGYFLLLLCLFFCFLLHSSNLIIVSDVEASVVGDDVVMDRQYRLCVRLYPSNLQWEFSNDKIIKDVFCIPSIINLYQCSVFCHFLCSDLWSWGVAQKCWTVFVIKSSEETRLEGNEQGLDWKPFHFYIFQNEIWLKIFWIYIFPFSKILVRWANTRWKKVKLKIISDTSSTV